MRDKLLESVASTIKTYREGELDPPTVEHVEHWLKQFTPEQQLPFLREFDHVIKQTFIMKEEILSFLKQIVQNPELTNGNPRVYWKNTNFLQIQKHGQSQKEMLKLFDVSLTQQCGIRLSECGKSDGDYIYIDDVIFSGRRAGDDLESWIKTHAPVEGTLYVIVIAHHTLGHYQLERRLDKALSETKKNIKIKYRGTNWKIENRKSKKNESGVLWPSEIPQTQQVKDYLALPSKFPFDPRQPDGVTAAPFSSKEGRRILEQEFLVAGARIRALSENPTPSMRPLGYSQFGVGFGSMIVTYRNCPNNCPLAIWWGNPEASSGALHWYPLLPREGYSSAKNIFNDITDLTL